MRDSTVILGAGVAGLSCARALDSSVKVLERAPEVGGLARTISRDGFLFDCAGHWLHLGNDVVRSQVALLLSDRLLTLDRRAAVYSNGVRTPYPFQVHTYGLPTAIVADCLLGYFDARERAAKGLFPPPQSFADFIQQKLGDGFSRHFMEPYNTKLWTVPPASLSASWCSRFVPVPAPTDVVMGALTLAGAPTQHGYNATFYYPREGGIRVLPDALRREVAGEVRCGVAATRVRWRTRTVQLDDGSSRGYRQLVSTMPLPDLVDILEDAPPALVTAAQALCAASVTYWDVGCRGSSPTADPHWLYVPDPSLPFYRVGSPSAVCPALCPPGHRSYCVEVSHTRGCRCDVSDDQILAGLRRLGLMGPSEEPVLWSRTTIDCAYVILNHAQAAARSQILSWLETEDIFSIGRYGSWTYGSMEDAIIQGEDAARRIRELP